MRRLRRIALIALVAVTAAAIGAWLARDRIAVIMLDRELAARPLFTPQPLPAMDPSLRDGLAAFLSANHQSPESFVLNRFDACDVVFLGEHHRVRHDVLFVQRLIPLLYDRGVRDIGLEFANHDDQDLIDGLVTGDSYDEALARLILYRSSVAWGYQEYADLFRAAWQVNRDRPPGTPPFRVVGLNARRDWSQVRSAEDLTDPAVLDRVWFEGPGDEFMARVILREFVHAHVKALVYCGMHHAFTRYRQPTSLDPDGRATAFFPRTGNIVFDEIGDRACTILLHCDWVGRSGGPSRVRPADGTLEVILHALPEDQRVVGFDTRASPLGALPCDDSSYRVGYDSLALGDLCDGYIVLAPFSAFTDVTPIPGFINRGNIEDARHRAANWRFRTGWWRFLGPTFMNHLFAHDPSVERHFAAYR